MTRRQAAFVAGGVALWTLVLYAGGLSAPFVYEDGNWLVWIQHTPDTWSWMPGRRLTAWTFRITAGLFGTEPLVFHVEQLGLHLVTGALVARLAYLLTDGDLLATSLSGALFCGHPLNSEAVNYVGVRADLLSTLFIVGAVVLALETAWPAVWRWSVMGCALVLAAMSKESAVMGLALVGWTLAIRHEWHFSRRVTLALTGLAGIVALFVMSRLWVIWEVGAAETGLLRSAALQTTALWRYLGLVLVPRGFNVDHDWAFVSVAVQFGALITTIGALALAWVWRRRLPWFAWVVGWIGLAIGPRLLLRTPEVLSEHQMMLPMVAICVAFGMVGRAVLNMAHALDAKRVA